MPPPLLFINSDPSGPRQSGREQELERLKVRSHAAYVAYHAKNLKSKRIQDGGRAFKRTGETISPDERRILPASALVPARSGTSEDKDNTAICKIRGWEHDCARSCSDKLQHRDNLHMLRDYPCYRGMRTDPFGCISRKASPYVPVVIDHYVSSTAPCSTAIYKIFNVTNIYTQYFLELLQHEDYLYCSTASTQSMIERIQNPGKPLSMTNLKLWNTAIHRLRQRILARQGRADGLTVLVVLLFAASARTTRDFEAHEMHRQSLIPLVASCGGLDNLGWNGLAKCNLLQWDTFWALNSGTGTTLFADSRPPYAPIYPQYPFSPEIKTLVSRLPLGFQLLAQTQHLAQDVIEVLARTADAHTLQATQGFVTSAHETFHSSPRKYLDFWEACPCLGTANGPHDQPGLEKLIVLALILYCLHAFTPTRVITVIYGGARQRLTTDIHRWTALHRNDEFEVEVWIWMNLIDSWRRADGQLIQQGIDLIEAFKQRFSDLITIESVFGKVDQFFTNENFRDRIKTYIKQPA